MSKFKTFKYFQKFMAVILLILLGISARAHVFPTFSPGEIVSGTAGVSTSLPDGSVAGEYLIYQVEADFVGTGGAQTSWSSTIHMELSDGGTIIYKAHSKADAGSMDSGNATTLKWSGLLSKRYNGGTGLTIRFVDDYHDASGPYTCDITNVKVTIYEANSQHEFPSYNVGVVTSNTSGQMNALPVSGLSGTFLIYSISADFTGVGGAQSAWSSTIEMSLVDGMGNILEPESTATSGALENTNSTTLTWTGTLSREYIGGESISTNFRDNYHDASGPYTCDLSNVIVEIFETTAPSDYPIVNPGLITSGTTGVNTSLNTSGVQGDHLFYVVTADFIGSGNAQTAWSSTIEMEMNDNGGSIYKELETADLGSADNGNATTLYWTGQFVEEYPGGTNLAIRFFDNYHDASGPYLSNINNVQVRTYPPANVSLPVELLSFRAELIDSRVVVEWEAASEYGNAYYTIERSADAKLWSGISRIPNQQYSEDINRYSIVDKQPIDGTSYYRLKQTDFNGSFSYSNIEKVLFNKPKAELFPNPVENLLTIRNINENAMIKIYNSHGRVVFAMSSKSNIAYVDVSNLFAGLYEVDIDGQVSKIIIK